MNTASLRNLANRYSAHTGARLSTIATYAVNDGKFFARLADGKSCTLATASKLLQWFSDHWPVDLDWPADIPRPPKSKKDAA